MYLIYGLVIKSIQKTNCEVCNVYGQTKYIQKQTERYVIFVFVQTVRFVLYRQVKYTNSLL